MKCINCMCAKEISSLSQERLINPIYARAPFPSQHSPAKIIKRSEEKQRSPAQTSKENKSDESRAKRSKAKQ